MAAAIDPGWDRAGAEVVEHLQQLIRLPTVNPPGGERVAAEYLARALGTVGIAADLLETAPGRAAVRGVLPGTGAAPPVLLLAHTDVVPADAAEWTVPPFAGVVQGGAVYGRGAIDDKGMLAVHLVTMCLLARARAAGAPPLTRDIVLIATPDEEGGGSAGIACVAARRPDWLRAEYALNEGGRIRVGADGRRTLLLQHAEKTPHLVTVTARGTAGHAGVPRPDNPVLALARALAAIADEAADPAHGISPTVLQGSDKSNVIPSRAAALLDVRTGPGESVDAVVDRLRRLVRDPHVTVELTHRGDTAPATPFETPFAAAIADAARALDPAITVQPYLSAGATDGAVLRRHGVLTYGLLPFPLDAADEGRMHGADERVPVAALVFGVRLVHGAVCRLAAAGPLDS